MDKEDYKMDGYSKNLESTNKEKLKSVFPECFLEGTLDIDKLLSLCGEYIDNDFEKYKFEWKGKGDCLRIAQQQSRGTLRPCPEESVNFSETENLYIEGDNLEVLKLLQTSYFNKVKMIYIDPPYNTGNDFIYKDKFGDSIANYKEITSQTTKSNPEHMGKYHTNWLNMMYPRLKLAHNLLKEDGVIFISIDDNEVHNLRRICDEVFGEENFIANIIWEKVHTRKNSAKYFSTSHEHILCYAKHKIQNSNDIGWIRNLIPREDTSAYKNPDNDPKGVWKADPITAHNYYDSNYKIYKPNGLILDRPQNRYWVYSEVSWNEKVRNNEVIWGEGSSYPMVKRYLSSVQDGLVPITLFKRDFAGDSSLGNKDLATTLDLGALFTYPKPIKLLSRLMQIGCNEDDIILDFFSGSATTAHAVMQLNKEDGGNRKYIMVQLPELCDEKSEAYKAGYKNICEIGKERIRRAGKQLVEDMEDHTALDIGFKVLKLDTSNITEWDSSYIDPNQDYQVLLDEFNRRAEEVLKGIKPDRSKLDVIFEIMMKLGVPFHIPLTQTDINGKPMYVVGDFLLLICLESEITFEDVKAMCDEAPAMLVCGEKGFADSCVMANIYYYLQEVEIELKLI